MGTLHKPSVESIQHLGSQLRSLPLFILANGLIAAIVLFFVLKFLTADMLLADARYMSADFSRATVQSIKDTENAVSGLSSLYASTSDEKVIAKYIAQISAKGAPFNAFLWANEKGEWQLQDLIKHGHADQFDAKYGWPAPAEITGLTDRLDDSKITYLTALPWRAFDRIAPDPGQKPLGILMRVTQQDGSKGVLLVVTTPLKLFGSDWPLQKGVIGRVLVRDRDNGNILLNSSFYDASSLADTRPVDKIVQSGDKYWDLRLDVVHGVVSWLLRLAPWIALLGTAAVTLVAALLTRRRNMQEEKIAAMSKDLKGAHSELQNRISERDRLFHALRKSERENRAVVNAVSDVIFEADQDGKIVFLNDTWKRITHREVGETLGVSLFDMIDKSDQIRQRAMFDEFVRGERQAYRVETRLSMGHGSFKPVEIAFSMVRMAEDKTIRIVGMMTDVEKRRKAEAAMKDAEQRFRAIFENSISGIYQTSIEGRFISANPALAEILGYDTAEELIESVTDIAQQVYVRPEDRAAFTQKLLFEGRISGIETEVRRKDGSHIWIMENARAVHADKGGVAYYEGSVWDVTERKIAEEATRQARVQAEISSRWRMEFLSNMSHELRTPLNVVIGFSEIIKDEIMGPIGTPVYKEYMQDIYNSGSYLLKIISEILEVSKIETGSRELNINNFKLSKALNACMTILSTRAEQAGVTVEIDLPEDLPQLLAEELGFKQIMLNLIGNAIKFTPSGGKVRVTAYVDGDGGMAIDVTDTGIGMTTEEKRKAMVPFGKVDTSFSGMKEGTGLGLTIVDALVRLHGGVFMLLSEKGQGTTARVVMPRKRVYHIDPAQRRESPYS